MQLQISGLHLLSSYIICIIILISWQLLDGFSSVPNFLMPQFLRLSLARIFHEAKYAILRENLAMMRFQCEILRNCDLRQVLCFKKLFRRLKSKNVSIFANSRVFSCSKTKLYLSNVVKKSVLLQSKFFSNFPCLNRNIFVCKFV